jgi:GT2 family glycosyltransferase
MRMKRLSVITITFNNFDELKASLNSLEDLGVESVIVNGGNCQKTITYLAQGSHKSLTEKDHGISDAFNKGFRLSNGEYITFLNSGDVLLDKTYYSEAVEFLDTHPDFDFVYADIQFIDQFAGPIRICSGNRFPAMPFLHPTLIVRRKKMEEVGLFNLDYKIAMDLDFAYRLVKSGAKGHYIPRMVVEMDGQGVSSKQFTKAYREVFRVAMANKDFSFRSCTFFLVRGIALLGKIVLLKTGMAKSVTWYRQKRYGLKKPQ